jgi:hypothetical protein
LRSGHPALRTGSFAALLIGDTSPSTNDDTTYAFARSNDHETVIVVLNKGNVENELSVRGRDCFPDGTVQREALTGETMKVSAGASS